MEAEEAPANKKPRTSEDFYLFCCYILEYENYERQKQEELRNKSASPLDSAGSMASESNFSSGQEEDTNKPTDDDTDGGESDSWDAITCYCKKPFAGRPMIECTNCLTWVHLSCAKIRKTHIPDVFYCVLCKNSSSINKSVNNRKSSSSNSSSLSLNSSPSKTNMNETGQNVKIKSSVSSSKVKNLVPFTPKYQRLSPGGNSTPMGKRAAVSNSVST